MFIAVNWFLLFDWINEGFMFSRAVWLEFVKNRVSCSYGIGFLSELSLVITPISIPYLLYRSYFCFKQALMYL
jgi:hypothetical protein